MCQRHLSSLASWMPPAKPPTSKSCPRAIFNSTWPTSPTSSHTTRATACQEATPQPAAAPYPAAAHSRVNGPDGCKKMCTRIEPHARSPSKSKAAAASLYHHHVLQACRRLDTVRRVGSCHSDPEPHTRVPYSHTHGSMTQTRN